MTEAGRSRALMFFTLRLCMTFCIGCPPECEPYGCAHDLPSALRRLTGLWRDRFLSCFSPSRFGGVATDGRRLRAVPARILLRNLCPEEQDLRGVVNPDQEDYYRSGRSIWARRSGLSEVQPKQRLAAGE